MNALPPIPTPATDPLNQADWLEIVALSRADRNASIGDLRQVLVATGTTSGEADESDEELLALAAMAEIERRVRHAGAAYPYRVDETGAVIEFQGDDTGPYLFCLVLSWLGADRAEAGSDVAKLFEELAVIAARTYLGHAVRFGHPRDALPRSFGAALREVCERVMGGEPRSLRPEQRDAKDGCVDVVAWRDMDPRPGKVALFGQCAAGGNWVDKLGELNIDAFMRLYLKRAWPVDPVRGFFTPFHVDDRVWWDYAVRAGLVFDRARISCLAQAVSPTHDAWTARHIARWRAGRMPSPRARRTRGRRR